MTNANSTKAAPAACKTAKIGNYIAAGLPPSEYTREEIADMLGQAWKRLRAGFMKASVDGLLTENIICDKSIEWHSSDVCFDETEKLYGFLEVIQEALSFIEPLFADLDREHEFTRSYLADLGVGVVPDERAQRE